MFKYVLKRILIFLPTLLVISLITFFISTNAPGDPVEQMMTSKSGEGSAANLQATEDAYIKKRQQLGLDLPIFYFSFSNQAVSDTAYRIPKVAHRKTLDRLVNDYGNWDQISDYYYSLKSLETAIVSTKKNDFNATSLITIREGSNALYKETDDQKVEFSFESIKKAISDLDKAPPPPPATEPIESTQEVVAPPAYSNSLAHLNSIVNDVELKYNKMKNEATAYKNLIPSFSWFGITNQYHRWFFGDKPLFGDGDGTWKSKGFLRGDFGISYKDQRPVGSVLMDAVRWTFGLSLLSIFITYLFAIPLGIFSARNKGSFLDQLVTTILFILFSVPSFWVGTLMVIYLCGGDYLSWFPAFFKPDFSGGLFNDIKELAYNMFLPLICWTYAGFAYLSRQMRGGMLTVLGQDYIRTAKSKGLADSTITWKHALRNSLLPIITLFAAVFPAAIGGAIALEIIFSIPGMGKIGYEAVVGRNYPIVFAVMMFSAILTLVGYLVADILYAVIDPRISFSKK